MTKQIFISGMTILTMMLIGWLTGADISIMIAIGVVVCVPDWIKQFSNTKK